MKKMFCEICGSNSLKKENDVFVCQECGTEYSLESAKKLLKEIGNDSLPIKELGTKEKINIEKMKLEYDLLCWHNYYQKCHELEDSFEIKDDKLNSCSDISSNRYKGDIGYREVVYDVSNESYFENNIYPKLRTNYLQKKDELTPLYDKAKIKGNQQEAKRVASLNDEISNTNAKKYVIKGVYYSGVVLFILSIGLMIIGFIFRGMYSDASGKLKADSFVTEKSFISYDEWIENNIDELEIFKNHVSEKKKMFLDTVKKEEEGILNSRQELIEIRNNLTKEIPLPEKYSDEYHVNALLALVLNCRADTLKEAINLFETESYRNTVVSSLNALNYNIAQLNNNIRMLQGQVHNLTSTVVQGFSTLIQQNNYISRQLDAIRFDTRYLMIDNFLS